MTTEGRDSPRHPIRIVARRTGLTPAALRAWEKRYGVVVPSRTEGGQRLYSDEDVLRLSLLHRAVEEGRSISQVAAMCTEELQGLVREDDVERCRFGVSEPLVGSSGTEILENAKRAVDQMDSGKLERVLTRGVMVFSVPKVIDDIVVPLLSWIGAAWQSGRIGPAHEHLAIVVIRGFLEWVLRTVDVGDGAPVLVGATLAGERHELGALLSVVSGAAEGWKGLFVGPDLPAEEIVSAALRLEAEVVTLSCVTLPTAQAVPREIMKIRMSLPAGVHLIVGGAMVASDEMVVRREGVSGLPTFPELRARLRKLGSSR